jgi:signal transduction histidine kinase
MIQRPGQESADANQLDQMCGRLLDVLFEKDRLSYLGKIVRGLIHNVNGPLQNISMLVEVLTRGQDQMDGLARSPQPVLRDKWDTLSEKQRQRLARLTEQVFLLSEMLRDFMVLQEIERNESEVDIKLVLQKLASIFRADLFLKHQVDLQLLMDEAVPLVRVRGRDLIAALIHLFQNAIRAVRESETKRVVIECRREADRIRITFRDSGCGLPADEDVERLFELFHTRWPELSPKADTGEKYFGFGLFAARRLLAPYGAKVGLERRGDETLSILEIPLTP